MDTNLAIIFAFVMLILLTVLPFAYLISKRVHEHEERKLELEARIEEAKAMQIARASDEVQNVEDRLRVLERIATDGDGALARQIEALRAPEPVGERA